MTCASRICVVILALFALAPGLPPDRAEASHELREARPQPPSAGPHTPVVIVRNGP